MALGVGGAHRDLDAGFGPQAGDLGRVDLRSTGLDVVEVAPREEVDPPDAAALGELGDLVDGVDEVGGVGHGTWGQVGWRASTGSCSTLRDRFMPARSHGAP